MSAIPRMIKNTSSSKAKVTAPPSTEASEATETHFSVSPGLAARLAKMNASLVFTSYQSGQLYLMGVKPDGGINIHQTAISKPMGLCRDESDALSLTSAFQIMRFENALEANERVNEVFDACYVPRLVHVTGDLDAHDIGLDASGGVVFVNTRFNCLARPSRRHSFEEIWRPPFISTLIDEDRCHLNGLAIENGEARYVTAISRSNTIDGWRDRRFDGGIVVDVRSGEIVCEGLSMPHSPRLHDGKLWILNSGTGELGTVTFDTSGKGSFQPQVFCPGFLRGLRFHEMFAIVGLSKPRYKRFERLALDQKLREADSEPWCGIQIIDLKSGSCVDWLRIDGAVAELYDLEVLPGTLCPMAVGPDSPEIMDFITFKATS